MIIQIIQYRINILFLKGLSSLKTKQNKYVVEYTTLSEVAFLGGFRPFLLMNS